LFGAFACEAGFAFALACVAEGGVEGAVGAFRGVADDAVDDELRLRVEYVVGLLARGERLRYLVVEVVYALACRACGADRRRLELCKRHPAERFVGRERPPSVEHPFHLLFSVFRAFGHVSVPFCAPWAHTWVVDFRRACEARVVFHVPAPALKKPNCAAYRPTSVLKDAILLRNVKKLPFAGEDFASGSVYLSLSNAILKPGNAILKSGNT
jgi:hypothetical protein